MKSTSPKQIHVFCNELCRSNECTPTEVNLLNQEINNIMPNVTIRYDKFVRDPENLPARIIDLLQIAAFIFCADRLINRGSRDSINNGSWARDFTFHIPVLDIDFWQNVRIQRALSDALEFMTGDRRYTFIFQKTDLGHLLDIKQKQLTFASSIWLKVQPRIPCIEIWYFRVSCRPFSG
jgi:hypothetical protein